MKLSDYLSQRGIKRSDFAGTIGVSQSYVTMICQGKIWPGRDVVTKINAATDGEVTANDFVGLDQAVTPTPAPAATEAA